MPLLGEYIKLRSELKRALTTQELDDNFLYVANEWNTQRRYKKGFIVYHDAGLSGNEGKSWWRATIDNGPNSTFDLGSWESIGAFNAGSGSILVESNSIQYTVNVVEFDSTHFIVTNPGSTALIQVNTSAVNPYWLLPGDTNIGGVENDASIIHTGDVVIGTGTFPSAYKLSINGTANITGDLTLGGTINNVDISNLAADYLIHQHTALPTTYANYSILFPNATTSLADFSINTTTLVNGHILTWNNSSKRWVNSAPSSYSIATLSDTSITSPSNNQLLRYNSTLAKWQNVTITADANNGISTAPFVHSHNTLYYTKTQLNTSGAGGLVHWNNVTAKPNDAREYLLATAPVSSSPLNLTSYRVLTSSNGSVNINTATSNVIDISLSSVFYTLQVGYDNDNVVNGVDVVIESLTSGQTTIGIGANVLLGNTGANVISFGDYSSYNNINDDVIAIGYGAAYDNANSDIVSIGTYAGYVNSGEHVISIGYHASESNTGDYVNSIGRDAGINNTGSNVNALGYSASKNGTGSSVNSLGNNSAQSNSGSHVNGFGNESVYSNSGSHVNGLGQSSARGNTGTRINAMGYHSAYNNSGNDINVFGNRAGKSNTGSNINAFGNDATFNNTGSDINAMGFNAAISNAGSNINAFGQYSALDNIGNDVNAFGDSAAYNNIGDNINAFGYAAAHGNTSFGTAEGNNVNALGYSAAYGNTGNDVNSFGYSAAYSNTGDEVIALGNTCAKNNSGNNVIAMGYISAQDNTADYIIALGYSAGDGNTGINLISLGQEPAVNNTGDHVIAIGKGACENNSGDHVIALGMNAANNNLGSDINAFGDNAALCTAEPGSVFGNDINAFGYHAAYDSVGSDVNALGRNSAESNTGNDVNAFGNNAAKNNTGNDVVAIGRDAGIGNTISTAFIISNSSLPSYANHSAASAAITGTGIAGNTYLYHNQATDSIGAVRL